MPEAANLMQAVLGAGYSRDQAEAVLHDALASDADPLHWCAVHLGLDQGQIMRRAANWLHLPFHAVVPQRPDGGLVPARLEMLADIRVFRIRVMDRDVAFVAPDFFSVLRLKRALDGDPGLRDRICLVPAPALKNLLVEAAEDALVDGARQNLTRFWPFAAAQLDLSVSVRWGFALALVVLSALVLAAPLSGQLWLLPVWVLFVILPAIIRIGALLTPPGHVLPGPMADDAALPLYSILVPLRDEANMVDQLCVGLGRLDYPREKLEVIFVVESRSPETVDAVRRHLGDARFKLVIVPDTAPRTKPKALDFALPLCRGEFVVVYDAEDQPDPAQLRRIVAQFRRQPQVQCIQARLVIRNGADGPLPALFAGEYAGLFAVMLPALARWNAVMPLGGTSNHFRLAGLRQLGGWDAYNVTEDADLGVRLARRRLATATSTSFTDEDAPARLQPWLGQRTRWMKGWMQTFVVHNRRPRLLLADLGWRSFLLFEITLLGMLMAPFLYIGFGLVFAWLLLTGPATSDIDPVTWAYGFVFLLGHGSAIALNLVGLRRTGQKRLWVMQALLPFYWLLIAWAMLRALFEFVRRPFHWFKTPHEITTMTRVAARPATR